jgi:hypothetical protein
MGGKLLRNVALRNHALVIDLKVQLVLFLFEQSCDNFRFFEVGSAPNEVIVCRCVHEVLFLQFFVQLLGQIEIFVKYFKEKAPQ